jgi:aminopeptidase
VSSESRRTELRWPLVAKAIADGLAVDAGELVSVFLTDVDSFPIVEAFCAEVYRRGAVPHVVLTDERIDSLAVQLATTEVLRQVPVIEAESMRAAQVHVSFRGMLPPTQSQAPADKIVAQRQAKGAISTLRWQQTRWAIVRVPTVEWARFVGIPVDHLFDEFFAGCLFDWVGAKPQWERLADRIDSATTVRIVSDDTDLTLGVAGRHAVVFAGQANWPDGEVATAPLDDAVDGHITFPGPFFFAGERVSGLRIEFAVGEAQSVTADEGGELARALIATDPGARRIGELGIGLNPSMRSITGDLLFDEKILGTMHIAMGRAYPECGGINVSSLHWDIVKDLRPSPLAVGGTIYLDGVPILLEGVPQWH